VLVQHPLRPQILSLAVGAIEPEMTAAVKRLAGSCCRGVKPRR
jgi:hypothetical protein